MVGSLSRRARPLLSLALGAFAWVLVYGPVCKSFLNVAPVTPLSRVHARTVMHGFKEDFEAWRSALSPEEKKLVQEQAEGEFNKKFRKSDDFKKNLQEEKVKSFAKILGKFFDSEAEDYKKEEGAKVPDYDGLSKKANEKKMDFSLKNKIVEVNRDADRRYHFATMKIREAERKGERFPQSSPLMEIWTVQNNDTESHENALGIIDFIEQASKDPSCPPDAKAYMNQWVEQGIPPIGENFELLLPQVLVTQLHTMRKKIHEGLANHFQNMSQDYMNTYIRTKVPEMGARVIKHFTDKYVSARDEVERDVQNMKAFYRSQKDIPGKTKADVLKEIWAELPKYSDKPVPPLDEEMLAELAEEPATAEGEFKHSWGTADVLYKSEAIDAFGMKYLLGVFETKAEAQKAFADWNSEYEKARVEMKAEMEQWTKQEQARLDRDTSGQDRIKKVLEEARR